MIPLQPLSIKFTDDERVRLKALATALGWSESQVVRDSVEAIIQYVQSQPTEAEPKIVGMAREGLRHDKSSNPLKISALIAKG